jgi:hypothetical protein
VEIIYFIFYPYITMNFQRSCGVPNYIRLLPEELIYHIAKNLDIKSVERLYTSTKYLRITMIDSYTRLWIRHFRKKYLDSYNASSDYNKFVIGRYLVENSVMLVGFNATCGEIPQVNATCEEFPRTAFGFKAYRHGIFMEEPFMAVWMAVYRGHLSMLAWINDVYGFEPGHHYNAADSRYNTPTRRLDAPYGQLVIAETAIRYNRYDIIIYLCRNNYWPMLNYYHWYGIIMGSAENLKYFLILDRSPVPASVIRLAIHMNRIDMIELMFHYSTPTSMNGIVRHAALHDRLDVVKWGYQRGGMCHLADINDHVSASIIDWLANNTILEPSTNYFQLPSSIATTYYRIWHWW